MRSHRDLGAFDERAAGYDVGWLGRLHHEISDRTAALVLEKCPSPRRVLDVGCGTGHLLRRLARSCPHATELAGIDPARSMVETAQTRADDDRLCFTAGEAEHLPFSDGAFDAVVSTTSFDHWLDQQAGLCECVRVISAGGRLVLVDQFSRWLAPTMLAGRRGKARTIRRATRLVVAAGFRTPEWHDLYSAIIKAVTATK